MRGWARSRAQLSSRRLIAAAAIVAAPALSPVAGGLASAATGSAGAAATSASAAGGSARAATTPRCKTAGLVVWLDTEGDGAAGSTFYTLNLTNLSGHACTLRGYPGVSAVNLSGGQVGRAASRSPVLKFVAVRLGRGATAEVGLRVVDALNFSPSSCGPVTAAGLRVYPPGATTSKVVPYPLLACSRPGPVYLTVQAVTRATVTKA